MCAVAYTHIIHGTTIRYVFKRFSGMALKDNQKLFSDNKVVKEFGNCLNCSGTKVSRI